MEAPCSPAERDFRCAPSSLQGSFDCKEFCPFFDSLSNPAAPLGGIFATLRQAAGNALAMQYNLKPNLS